MIVPDIMTTNVFGGVSLLTTVDHEKSRNGKARQKKTSSE